jgi:cytosine/uracil/thiamine/allantoin permease
MFFTVLCWCMSQLVTNILADTSAVANDLTLSFLR